MFLILFHHVSECYQQFYLKMSLHIELFWTTAKKAPFLRRNLTKSICVSIPLCMWIYKPFLSSGWLEPLLNRVQENPNTVICPSIGLISAWTFSVGTTGANSVGIFKFPEMTFNWGPPQQIHIDMRKSEADPLR